MKQASPISNWLSTVTLVLTLMVMTAKATGALVTLAVPTTTLPCGGVVRIELLVFNPSEQAVAYTLPTVLDGKLTKDSQVWLVNLQGQEGDFSVTGGGFVRLPLRFVLPSDVTGRLVLEMNQPAVLRAVIDVGPQVSSGAGAPFSDFRESENAEVEPSLRAASRLKRYYADHFSGHEPMYFVWGGDRPAVKFQLSFKYRLLNDNGPLATRFPKLRGLHVAYTQRSLWDITSASSPFFDTSYMPEFMYESLAADTGKHSGFTWLGYQAAFQHESNGRDGADSRSLNTFYIRPMFVWGNPEGWRLILRPKFFAYLSSNSDNKDLKKYRGYSELRAIFGKNNRLSVSLTGRIGDSFDKGSAQVDVTYPVEFLTGNFATYLMAQYWNGYGESLLRYDERSSTLRFGFSLAR